MIRKPLTAKDIEYILTLAQDTVSLNSPVYNKEGDEDCEFGDLLVDTGPTVEELVIEKDKSTILLEYIEKYLEPREEKIIKMRFGFDDGVFKTLEEVAQTFGVTRERIRQIERKALRKLRYRFAVNNIEGDAL